MKRRNSATMEITLVSQIIPAWIVHRSSALDDEAEWRVRDPSWVDDVESSSSVNGSASYFDLEWRGRIYAEGELASNIVCCSAGTFDAEWGGRDGAGMESGDYSIFS